MAKPTIKKLEAELSTALEEARIIRESGRLMREDRDAAKAHAEQVRKQFDDLKTRLHASEMENQRLRGYVQRVQEDDVVREELVTVGAPEGEQHLVPKRKASRFEQPSDYDTPNSISEALYSDRYRDRQKPKHWITY